MKKMLVVVPSLNVRSGVTNHVMNYYNVLKNDMKIDFAVLSNDDKTYREQIQNDGNKVYNFSRYNIKKIKEFFKNNSRNYDIIHCHIFNFGIPYLYYAKKYKIKTRIIHIHSQKYSENIIKYYINKIAIKLCCKYANNYFACSEEAGKKAFNNKKFTVINNGLLLENYKYNITQRDSIRKKLNIPKDCFVFGMVGRLSKGKNNIYALEVFKNIKEDSKYKDSKFLMIGNGEMKHNIINYISDNNLTKDVIMLEGITDIYNYYMAMDCFIFPSLHEGLGMVLIEAQATGLPCFCTNTLPKEVFISNLVKGLELEKGPKYWAEKIIKDKLERKDVMKNIIKAGFSIEDESFKLKEIYIDD